MNSLYVLFGIFVVLAEVIRRDAIKEGNTPRHAWFFGLFFGGVSTLIALGILAVIT